MGKYPSVACKLCGKEFESQIVIEPAVYAKIPNIAVGHNAFICPHCDQPSVYSERDFRYTSEQAEELARFGKIVEAFIDAVEITGQPLQAASDLLAELEAAQELGDASGLRKSEKFSFLKKWIPDTPEKIAAYIVIVGAIIQFLGEEPDAKVDQTIIMNHIDQTVIIQLQDILK